MHSDALVTNVERVATLLLTVEHLPHLSVGKDKPSLKTAHSLGPCQLLPQHTTKQRITARHVDSIDTWQFRLWSRFKHSIHSHLTYCVLFVEMTCVIPLEFLLVYNIPKKIFQVSRCVICLNYCIIRAMSFKSGLNFVNKHLHRLRFRSIPLVGELTVLPRIHYQYLLAINSF